MSERVLSRDFLKAVTDSLGVHPLKAAVAEALTGDVEYRLREIIQEALKFMKHAKRNILTTADVDAALRVRNIEPLFGFSGTGPSQASDGKGGLGGVKYKAEANDLYSIEDELLDIETLLTTPLPPMPLAMTFTAHWLAIEGVQPLIPQNPAPTAAMLAATNAQQLSAAAAAAAATYLQPPAQSAQQQKELEAEAVQSSIAPAEALARPLVKHVLSKEAQLYFEKITAALMHATAQELRELAWQALAEDAGLHQIVPYLIQFIQHQITHHLSDFTSLSSMLHAVDAMLKNDHIFIEPYLHQLMPSLLTCVVAKKLGDGVSEEHFAIRRFAARLSATVVSKFSAAYTSLKPRTIKTLIKALLDLQNPFSTHYGAINGLRALGKEGIQVVLIANAEMYMQAVDEKVQLVTNQMETDAAPTPEDPTIIQRDADKCKEALKLAIAEYFYTESKGSISALKHVEHYKEMRSLFGPELDRRIETGFTQPADFAIINTTSKKMA